MANEVRNTPFGSSASLRPTRPDQNRFDDDGNNAFSGNGTAFNRGQSQTRFGSQPNFRFGSKPQTFSPQRIRSRVGAPPPRPPQPAAAPPQLGIEDIQAGASSLVTASTKGGMFRRAGTESAQTRGENISNLFQAPIAGLGTEAVEQQAANFATVTDPGTGFTVPNLADPTTRDAWNRYQAPNRVILGEFSGESQRLRDADPTRVAFQNRFFASETLKDVNNLRPLDLKSRQDYLAKRNA